MKQYMRFRRPFAVAALALVLAGCGGPKVEDHLAKARKFEADNDLRAAVIEYRSALAQAPNAADARWALAQVLLQVGDGPAAEKEIDAAVKAGLKSEAAIYGKARAMLMRGEPSMAETYLSEHKVEPPTAPYLVAMGDVLAALGRLDDAGKSYEAARTLDAKSSDALLGLARLALSAGRQDEAEKLADQASALADGNPETALVRGNIYYAQGRYAAAVDEFKAAAKARPYLVVPKLAVIQALMAGGHFDQAGPFIDEAVAQAPNSPIAATYRAYQLSLADNLEPAIDLCRKILSKFPETPQAQMLLGSLYLRTGALENAAELLQTYVNANPDNTLGRKLLATAQVSLRQPDKVIATLSGHTDPAAIQDTQLLTILGSAYVQLGKPDVAQKYFDRAVALAPADDNVAMRARVLQLVSGDADKGLAALQEMIDQKPEFAPPQRALIAYHLRKRDADKALAVANDAVRNAPKDVILHNLRATALLATGDTKAARAELDTAISLAPDAVGPNLDLAALDLSENKPAEAQARLEKLLGKSPDNPPLLAMLARIHTLKGENDTAHELLEKCRSAAPQYVICVAALARNHFAAGRLDEADKAINEALALDPANPSLTLLAGDIAMLRRDPGSARKSYEALSKTNADDPGVLLRLAKAENGMGKLEEARAHVQKILAQAPDSIEALSLLSVVELKRGDEAAARGAVSKCLPLEKKAGPCAELAGDLAFRDRAFAEALAQYEKVSASVGSFAMLTKQVNTLRAMGNAAEGRVRLQKWASDNPKDPRPLVMLAAEAKGEGKADEARALYEQALGVQQDNPVALNNLTMLYIEAGDKRALDTGKKAYEALPGNAVVADTYGWALVKNGQAEQGVKLLATALDSAPHNPTFAYHLAVAKLNLGDTQAARTALEKALQTQAFDERKDAEKLLASLR